MNKIEDFTEGSVWNHFDEIYICIGINDLVGDPEFKSEKDYGYVPNKDRFHFNEVSWKRFIKIEAPQLEDSIEKIEVTNGLSKELQPLQVDIIESKDFKDELLVAIKAGIGVDWVQNGEGEHCVDTFNSDHAFSLVMELLKERFHTNP